MKAFADLDERELLAVAIASEEEDSRIYMSFAEDMQERFPATAQVFAAMADEENDHRRQLLDAYTARFGQHLPPIRREDVKGFSQAPADVVHAQPAYRCGAQGGRDHGGAGGALLQPRGGADD